MNKWMQITVSKGILLLSDFLSIFLPILLVFLLLGFSENGNAYFPGGHINEYIYIHLSISLICVSWFGLRLRHYTYRKPFWFELKEVIRTLLIFFIIELAIVALSKLYVSRTFWLLTWSLIFLLFPLFRILIKKILLKWGIYKKETIIIGDSEKLGEVYQALLSEDYLGFDIKYVVSSNFIINKATGEIEVLTDDLDIISSLSLDKDTVQFVLALSDEDKLSFWLRYLAKHNCRSISVIPNVSGIPLYGTDMSLLFSHEMLFMRINNNLAKRSSRIMKRTMDVVGSLAIITLLSPVLLYLYFSVKKDGGNAIYGHPRIGHNGKTFNCLKFRSMVVNSKEVLDELLRTDPEARAEWEKDFKLKNDPRVTKIGAFIRKTSLDELPQLFNVLKGEMSLVGPRPVVADELERYQDDVEYYLMAKPGMTGLWQVSGRNDVDYNTRVYFDSWYVKNWSLWNDIAILFKTVNVVLKRDGAY